ncbi:FAD/NAD(P)-binding protein [Streptomonospora sp. PA3]|nr:FAD/NAD(P)-binding protein [Streptomonospora sp. PA3]MUL43188.1 FAD/NAD(P)-binding protein [Streptomonospora sp. PA3]
MRLAIIGAGPSCTYVMDRLAAHLSAADWTPSLEVRVFDSSGFFGAGEVHSPDQPETSYLNRIAGQVSFAADESVQEAGPLLDERLRYTLHGWCRRRFEETGDERFSLEPEDWPKRFMHGLALQEAFQEFTRIVGNAPGVRLHLHHDEVTDLDDTGGSLRLVTASGERYHADRVLLVTGHSANDPSRFADTRALLDYARESGSTYVPTAYPLERELPESVVPPGSVTGCGGMGLTAIDVILHLTEGRGGAFDRRSTGGLDYRPSGREPRRIVAFSGSGLFTFARPYNAKERDPARLEHRGVFLVEETIERLRRNGGCVVAVGRQGMRHQLDFETQVFPVLLLEMAYLHYATLLGAAWADAACVPVAPVFEEFVASGGAVRPDASPRCLAESMNAVFDGFRPKLESLLRDRGPDALQRHGRAAVNAAGRFLTVVLGSEAADRWIADVSAGRPTADPFAAGSGPWGQSVDPADHRFSWTDTITPIPPRERTSPDGYAAAVVAFMRRDHLWAEQGNVLNPAKAAADGVWRDLRPVLADAVDFGGLTAESHREFLGTYMRYHNRLANGAALEVMEKILALVEAGVVDVSTGPGARVEKTAEGLTVVGPQTGAAHRIDVLVDGKVHPFDPETDRRPLYPNMLRRGLVRKWRNPARDGSAFEPGGLDLTPDFHPYRADGSVETRLTLIGPPSEGVMFFQLGALRPQQNHHVMRDILCWFQAFWRELQPRFSAPAAHVRQDAGASRSGASGEAVNG